MRCAVLREGMPPVTCSGRGERDMGKVRRLELPRVTTLLGLEFQRGVDHRSLSLWRGPLMTMSPSVREDWALVLRGDGQRLRSHGGEDDDDDV